MPTYNGYVWYGIMVDQFCVHQQEGAVSSGEGVWLLQSSGTNGKRESWGSVYLEFRGAYLGHQCIGRCLGSHFLFLSELVSSFGGAHHQDLYSVNISSYFEWFVFYYFFKSQLKTFVL